MEKIKKFFTKDSSSDKITRIIIVLGIFVIAIVIFLTGESFGYHRAQFSYRFGENYNRIFEGRRGGMMGQFPMDNMFTNTNGGAGTVVKVALPKIVISTNDGIEKTIVLNNKTTIRQFRNSIASSSVKVGDMIVVLGSPDQNDNIVAGLIRIVPPANSSRATTTAGY